MTRNSQKNEKWNNEQQLDKKSLQESFLAVINKKMRDNNWKITNDTSILGKNQ